MPTAALPIALLGPEPWQTGDLRKEGSAVAGCSAAFVRMVGNPLTNPHEREVGKPSKWSVKLPRNVSAVSDAPDSKCEGRVGDAGARPIQRFEGSRPWGGVYAYSMVLGL